jgi:Rab family protein
LKIKYVGDEQEKRSLQMAGLNLMDKTLSVQGARISFNIWDVGGGFILILVINYLILFDFSSDYIINLWVISSIGDHGSLDHVPVACKDAVAILFMFDLTSRSTLNRCGF